MSSGFWGLFYGAAYRSFIRVGAAVVDRFDGVVANCTPTPDEPNECTIAFGQNDINDLPSPNP
jgi:hypothetical protein